jgi:hypothetical protein
MKLGRLLLASAHAARLASRVTLHTKLPTLTRALQTWY